ncbi:prepilin-type N-terminal cleavage/methylation domain-containing protein, partial [Patescibacteria group bacterium]|nr:prepilin-type N-terminal cleavage/methylation domain-containing protein [Patescibacteria group bacterium]
MVGINNKGQSLLEVIVAMAIFALISAAMVSLSLGGLSALEQGGEQTQAEALAQEGVEAVRAIRDSAWNKLVYATSSVSINGSEWEFTGEDTTETIGQYTRTISFADVCRDLSDDIVDCPGSYTDLHSKKVTVIVDWEIRPGVNNSVQKITYLTNWDSINWIQTDWSGGDGQSIWSDATRYDSDDSNLDYGDSGEIKLASLGGGGCGAKVWSFVSSSDYTFDSDKIEVTGGMAQLFSSSGGLDGYTQGMWHLDEASGSIIDFSGNGNDLPNVKGSPQYSQSGKFANSLDFNANSSSYINHGSQDGLNFTGSFTIEAWVYRDVVATTYESVVSKWRETGNKRSYALVINPNNKLELWVSSNGSNETILTAVNTLPTSSWVHITATYDGSNLYIFQNGVLENQVSYSSGIADKASFFSISGADKFNGGNAFFNGKIDEVRISNTARWT